MKKTLSAGAHLDGLLRELNEDVSGQYAAIANGVRRDLLKLEARRRDYSKAEFESRREEILRGWQIGADAVARSAETIAHRVVVNIHARRHGKRMEPTAEEQAALATRIDAAWTGRVKPLLEAGIAMQDVVHNFAERGDEFAVRAVSVNGPAFLASRAGNVTDPAMRRSLGAAAAYASRAAESFDPEDLQEAAEAERQLARARERVEAHKSLAQTALKGEQLEPQAMIAAGLAGLGINDEPAVPERAEAVTA